MTGLAAAIAAVYLPALHYGYLNFDDNINVFENPYLYPVRLESFLRFWSAPYIKLYIPLTNSVRAVTACLARLAEGIGPRACPGAEYFHGLNIALHIANVILVFLLFRLLLRSSVRSGESGGAGRRDAAAAWGALFYGLHPVQVETVIWITALKDLLSTLFSLLALWLYLSRRKNPAPARRYFAAAVAFLLALLSKPSAVILPLIAAVIDRGIFGRSRREILRNLGWSAALVLPVVILAKIYQPDRIVRYVPPLASRILVVADALFFYFIKILFPVRLAIDYGRTPGYVLGRSIVFFPLLAVLTLVVLLLARRIRGVWATVCGIVVIGILPVSGLIPFFFQNFSTVKDRYLYFPLIGPALALSWFLARPRRRAVLPAVLAVLLFLGLGSVRQRDHWRNMVALYQWVIRVNPKSFLAYNNLADYLARGGKINFAGLPFRRRQDVDPDLANLLPPGERTDLAIDYYRRALDLDPGYTKARISIAIEYTRKGDLAAASCHYAEAVRQDPRNVDAQNNFGYVLAALGRMEEAIPHYQEALRGDPAFPGAHLNLANALTALECPEEAIFHYQEALRLDPAYARAHYSLALLYHLQGELVEALVHYEAALRAAPDFVEARHNRRVLLENLLPPVEREAGIDDGGSPGLRGQ